MSNSPSLGPDQIAQMQEEVLRLRPIVRAALSNPALAHPDAYLDMGRLGYLSTQLSDLGALPPEVTWTPSRWDSVRFAVGEVVDRVGIAASNLKETLGDAWLNARDQAATVLEPVVPAASDLRPELRVMEQTTGEFKSRGTTMLILNQSDWKPMYDQEKYRTVIAEENGNFVSGIEQTNGAEMRWSQPFDTRAEAESHLVEGESILSRIIQNDKSFEALHALGMPPLDQNYAMLRMGNFQDGSGYELATMVPMIAEAKRETAIWADAIDAAKAGFDSGVVKQGKQGTTEGRTEGVTAPERRDLWATIRQPVPLQAIRPTEGTTTMIMDERQGVHPAVQFPHWQQEAASQVAFGRGYFATMERLATLHPTTEAQVDEIIAERLKATETLAAASQPQRDTELEGAYKSGAREAIEDWTAKVSPRIEIAEQLRAYASTQEHEPRVNAEALLSRRMAEQILSGATEFDLSLAYDTPHNEVAQMRHTITVRNLQPLIDLAREQGIKITDGQATAVAQRSVLAVEPTKVQGRGIRA